tara:strand:- start:14854 stop:16497 length:1644 start_codon:yes stop_codon:yes gene_type:complete
MPEYVPLSDPPRRRRRDVGDVEIFAPLKAIAIADGIIFEAELGGANSGWTDLTADVDLGAEPIGIEYGIRGGGPLDRVASVGTMAWAMNNSARNSGGLLGYYTPGHTNARSGWEIGIAVRLKVTYNEITYYKFRGTLVAVEPDAGTSRRRSVACLAHDWMAEAMNTFVRDTAVQTSQRSDQILSTLVTNSARRQPPAESYETGQSTFAIALDNLRDERTTLLRAIADVVAAEVGYFYVKGDTVQGGTARFEDRHARPKTASSATFTNSMFSFVASRSRAAIYNHINVVTHPRTVDAAATTVLYSLTDTDSTPAIAHGETLPLTVFFRDATGQFARVGGDDVVTPVANTDYIANSQADGGGSDLTSDLTIVFSFTSNTATLSITNDHASSTAYLTTLQVRGKAVKDRYEVSVFKHDADSEEANGERDITYDMVFEDRVEFALGVADWFLALYGDIRTIPSAHTIKADTSAALKLQALAREPGDKITVTEDMTGISAKTYFINGVQMTINPGDLIEVSWVLAPADQSQAWILEDAVAGVLETSTYLGFV